MDHPLAYLYQRKVRRSWGRKIQKYHNNAGRSDLGTKKNCEPAISIMFGPIGIHDASLSFSYPTRFTGQPRPRKQTKLPVVASIPQAHCGSAVHHRTETGKSWQWNLRPTSWPKRHKQNDQVLNPNELEDQVDLGQSLQVRPQTLEALRHLEKNSKVGLPAARHLVWFAKELSLPPGCKPQPPQQCLKIGPGLASHIFATSTLLWKVQPTPFWERKGCVQWWYA